MHKKSTVPYTAFSHFHLKLPINFRIASLPGLAEATPLIAHEVVPHVARASGYVAGDRVQVVLVPDHKMLRQARDGRVRARVGVPWMGVRLHRQLPPFMVVTRLRPPFWNFEPPPIIQPTSLVQEPPPRIILTLPVALWGLLSLPHHLGEVVTELHFDAPISAFFLKGAHIATFVWQISSVNAHAFLAPVVAPARSAQTRRIACVGGVAAADVLIVVADRGQHVRCLQVVGLVVAGVAQPYIEVHGLFFFLDRPEELDGTFF